MVHRLVNQRQVDRATQVVYNLTMIVQCGICNQDFVTYPSKIASGRGKYCSKECQFKSQLGKQVSPSTQFSKGVKPHNFKGHTYTQARKGGKKYRLLYKPDHPFSSAKGYVREHRFVMESMLGRSLRPNEIVHHKDGDTLNNDPSNLEIMNPLEHRREHVKDSIHRRWHDQSDTK